MGEFEQTLLTRHTDFYLWLKVQMMFWLFVMSLLVSNAISQRTFDDRKLSGDCKCGVPGKSINRIIGGTEVNPHQYPWLVRIEGGGGSCTGTLISDRHVLTAFHCVSEKDESKPFDHVGEKEQKAHIGAHRVTDDDTDAVVTQVLNTPTDGFPPFPKFDMNNPESHDIVVYTLAKPVQFSSKVQPACLPKDAPRSGLPMEDTACLTTACANEIGTTKPVIGVHSSTYAQKKNT